MDSQTPDKGTIEEIAKQLAEGSASTESAEQLKELLDKLAQDGDLESLLKISGSIRAQFEAGQAEEDKEISDRLREVAKSLAGAWGRLTTVQKAAIAGGVAVVLLVIVVALASLGARPDESQASARTSKEQTPGVEEAANVTGEAEAPSQPVETDATPTDSTPTGATPTEAKSAAAAPTEKPSPTPSKAEYTIRACVGWQDDQEVGLPGSRIVWWTDQTESSREEMVIPNDDGCVKLPVLVSPDTEITLLAELPEGGTKLQIVGHAQEDGAAAWEAAEEGEAVALSTTLGEGTEAEYAVQFLVAAERTLSGEVLNEDGDGIPDAGVQLWARADPDGEWEPIDQGGTTTTDPDGTFLLTHTTGSPQVTYRVGLSNTVANRYVYTTTSVSGPDSDWVNVEDVQTSSVSYIETGAALGPNRLSVEGIVFDQALDYVLLSVEEAALAPRGREWETDSASSSQDTVVSKLITIDETNVDVLQARWEDVQLPPGTYAMEIWTPENTSARVTYGILSADQVLDTRVSYQSTRQDRGQVNEWIDFSVTLNPSLIIELPAPAPITVVAQPSLSTDNREYNLGGNVVFGVGPVRFVKQR